MITIFHMVVASAVVVIAYETFRAVQIIRASRQHSAMRKSQLAHRLNLGEVTNYGEAPFADKECGPAKEFISQDTPVSDGETPDETASAPEPIDPPLTRGRTYRPVISLSRARYSNFDLIELTGDDEFDVIEELRCSGKIPRATNYDVD